MGLVAAANFGYLLVPGLRKVYMDEFNQPGDIAPQLFSHEKSTKAVEYDLGIGGMGDLEEFNGTIPYNQDFQQQYRVSYVHKEYVGGIKVERRLVDDDQYNIIEQRPKQLAIVAKRTREKHGASLFNNAFNTSIFAGGDSKALCATDHTWVGISNTWSNSGTDALSATALEATRIKGMLLLDETNNLMDIQYDTLLIPPQLQETANIIIKSDWKSGTANNDMNWNKDRYNIIVWNRLTDTNNWYLIDSKYMKMFLKWYDRCPSEFNKDKDFDTYVAKYSAYMRYSFGFSDARWIYGQNVT